MHQEAGLTLFLPLAHTTTGSPRLNTAVAHTGWQGSSIQNLPLIHLPPGVEILFSLSSLG